LLRRDSASSKTPEGGSGDVKAKEPSIYTILQRVSVVIGLLAIVPLTRIWDRSWWIRILFVMIAVTLFAATTYDLLPRWSRRRPFALGVLLILALAVALAPEVLGGKDRHPHRTSGQRGESIRAGQAWTPINEPQSGSSSCEKSWPNTPRSKRSRVIR
jgi:hypothetical protein